MKSIDNMIHYFIENHVDYEFRTTVVKDFHQVEDFEKIGQWIKGAKRYYLQNFEDHGSCIQEGLQPIDISELKQCMEKASPYVEYISIRGAQE